MPDPTFSTNSLIFLDGEFSHQDPAKGGILSLGAIWLGDPHETFYMECRLRDDAAISPPNPERNDPGSLAVAGFTEEQAHDASKPSEKELLEAFFTWRETISNRGLGAVFASSAYLDIAYLEQGVMRHSLPAPRGWFRFLLLHSAVMALGSRINLELPLSDAGTSTLSLPAVCALTGMNLQRGTAHNALTDAIAGAEATYRLLEGKSFHPTFTTQPIPENLAK